MSFQDLVAAARSNQAMARWFDALGVTIPEDDGEVPPPEHHNSGCVALWGDGVTPCEHGTLPPSEAVLEPYSLPSEDADESSFLYEIRSKENDWVGDGLGSQWSPWRPIKYAQRAITASLMESETPVSVPGVFVSLEYRRGPGWSSRQ